MANGHTFKDSSNAPQEMIQLHQKKFDLNPISHTQAVSWTSNMHPDFDIQNLQAGSMKTGLVRQYEVSAVFLIGL
jgi:hypothetical protein